ncbi:hypothetical protein GCM10009724_22620 [Microbacterium lacticum]|nr:hypothetical protein MLA01_22340 [Microbacterium lacticum]GGI71221.1 hypothetical protein GCM10009724_22620 [Microbacterium lacticum]
MNDESTAPCEGAAANREEGSSSGAAAKAAVAGRASATAPAMASVRRGMPEDKKARDKENPPFVQGCDRDPGVGGG